MHIAFVVGKFPKLSKTFILSQITGLIERGYEVDIYADPLGYVPSKVHPAITKYKLFEKIYYPPSFPSNSFKRLLKAILCLLVSNWAHPLRLIRLLLFSDGNFQNRLKIWIYSSMPSLQCSSYDVIHCHFAGNYEYAFQIQTISSPNAKIVTTFHGYDVNVAGAICEAGNYQKLFARGNIYTANTSFTAKKASLLGCPPENIVILPVGLEIEKYPFASRSVQPGETIKLLSVGRLVEKKGIEYGLKAVAKVLSLNPDIALEYLIVGEGELQGRLESLAQKLGISNHVRFLGAMAQDELKTVYDSAHLFMLPSVTAANGDMEGQGLVLQEAQCAGLPVLSTLHNGIPDGVLDNQSGYLVPERDADALAEKINHLIKHPEIWPDMGRVGRKYVEEHYDINKLNDELVHIYEQLLIEPGSET